MNTKKLCVLFSTVVLNSTVGWAQVDSTTKDIYSMSLEELMNVQVVSASKKSENLFDAPLSASVLTREEIQKAGATSIMEALRLVPGIIVRQETNGNFDVHIRGLDNVPPNSIQVYSANTTTLVMIDNRPVYNYLQGGTFWESLPIDLQDIEKIEVVRGASATLYGPNAVSGVINIITRKAEKKGWGTTANAQYGSQQTAIANASIGYRVNDRWSAIVSGNFQGRGRDVSYYNPQKNQFYNTPDSLTYLRESSKAPQVYPHPDRAMNKYGANVFLHYQPNASVQVDLASGVQNSEVQNAYDPLYISSLATTQSKTTYADLRANVHGISTQVSYLRGKQDPNIGLIGSTYDFNTLDAVLEYDIKLLRNLSVKPGLNYRRAIYDDTPYWDEAKREGTFNARTLLETQAGSLRVEYQAFGEKLRLVGGARIDRFTYPKKGFVSYQAAANFKPSTKHLFRAVYSQAYRSAFIYDTYLNFLTVQPLTGPGIPKGSYIESYVHGNKNLNMLHSNMLELGYRAKLADNLSFDMEAYYTITKNYTYVVAGASKTTLGNPVVVQTDVSVENLPLSVHQYGTSLSVNYVLKRFQLKPFVTLQTTSLHDYSPYANTEKAEPTNGSGYNPNNIYSGIGTTQHHQFTPSVYGGAFVNYQLTPKLNLNLNPYYYSAHTYLHSDNRTVQDGEYGVQRIDPKLIINAKLSYSPVAAVTIFASVKNLLNNNAREYYRTDQIGAMVLGGISVQY